VDREPSALLEGAIAEAVRAGVYRRAARLNPKAGKLWGDLAAPHSARAAGLLAQLSDRWRDKAPGRRFNMKDE